MGFHFYADDTQLYLSFNTLSEEDRVCCVAQVESCVTEIDHWMASNKLKLGSLGRVVICYEGWLVVVSLVCLFVRFVLFVVN